MVKLYDSPGHDWFIQQTLVQVRRVLGLQQSGGTLTSPTKALHLLLAEYRVFLPSFAIAVASFVIAAERLLACYRERNWGPAPGQRAAVLLARRGVVVFGFSSLRFPQYFALILVPMYAYLWTEVWYWNRSLRVITVAAGIAVLAGLGSFWLRVGTYDDNVFAEVQHYAATSIPRTAVVIADEAVGDLISQPYCREQDERAVRCTRPPTRSPGPPTCRSSFQLGDPAFHELMRGAVPVKSFTGFNGTVTVWKTGATAPGPPALGVDLYSQGRYTPALVKTDGQANLAYIRHILRAQNAGIVWNLYSPGRTSSTVTRTGISLTPAEVATLTRQAQALGMGVEYRPLIRVGHSWAWEGFLTPPHQQAWFASLYQAELPYLRTAPAAACRDVRGRHRTQRAHRLPVLAVVPGQGARRLPRERGLLGVAARLLHPAGRTPCCGQSGLDPYPHVNLPATATVSQLVAGWDSYLAPRAAGAARPVHDAGSGHPRHRRCVRPTRAVGQEGHCGPQIQVRWFTAACKVAAQYHMRGIYFYEVNLTDDPGNPSPFAAFFEGKQGASAIASCRGIFR